MPLDHPEPTTLTCWHYSLAVAGVISTLSNSVIPEALLSKMSSNHIEEAQCISRHEGDKRNMETMSIGMKNWNRRNKVLIFVKSNYYHVDTATVN